MPRWPVLPLETTRAQAFARGPARDPGGRGEGAHRRETQRSELFYNAPSSRGRASSASTTRRAAAGVGASGELRPSRLIDRRARGSRAPLPNDRTLGDHLRSTCATSSRCPSCCPTRPMRSSACPISAPAARTTPARVPGGLARAGRHRLPRDGGVDGPLHRWGVIQMGGEGVDWVSHSMFTEGAVFQNLGDGTYWHSASLAIRQAVAAGKATITYKILFNDAVAMTGGQPVDGRSPRRPHRAPGGKRGRRGWWWSATTSLARGRGAACSRPAPSSTRARRSTRCSVNLATAGVTVLITSRPAPPRSGAGASAARWSDPARRVFINEQVCEGCGDCIGKSNCVAVLPHETPPGASADRPERLQQGLFLRRRLLPELRRRAGRHAAQEVGALSEAGGER